MTQRIRPLRPSFAPQLERMEDRTVPAVFSGLNGSTLIINTDNTGGSATVTSNTNGSVSVTSAAVTKTYTGVQNINTVLYGPTNNIFFDLRTRSDINVNISEATTGNTSRTSTGGGNDTIGLGVGSLNSGDDHHYNINLGNGTNNFTFRSTNIFGDDGVDLHYTGGVGIDNATYNLGNIASTEGVKTYFNPGAGTNSLNVTTGVIGRDAEVELNVQSEGSDNNNAVVANGTNTVNITTGFIGRDAQVDINANLFNGNDIFNLNAGAIDRDAEFNLNLNTGAGADQVFLTFRTFGENSNTNLNVNLGDGNDNINFAFNGAADDDADISLDLDGGNGFDTSRTTGAANVINVIDVHSKNMESVG